MSDGGTTGYINQIELRSLIREYKDDCKTNPDAIMSDALGQVLLNIANRFTSRSCFSNYSYREDFIIAAVEKMIKAVEKIDPDDPRSPFSYLTQTCYRAVINYIKMEKKYERVLDSVKQEIYDGFTKEFGLSEVNNPNYNDADIH